MNMGSATRPGGQMGRDFCRTALDLFFIAGLTVKLRGALPHPRI
jgi:hypothetical protein